MARRYSLPAISRLAHFQPFISIQFTMDSSCWVTNHRRLAYRLSSKKVNVNLICWCTLLPGLYASPRAAVVTHLLKYGKATIKTKSRTNKHVIIGANDIRWTWTPFLAKSRSLCHETSMKKRMQKWIDLLLTSVLHKIKNVLPFGMLMQNPLLPM